MKFSNIKKKFTAARVAVAGACSSALFTATNALAIDTTAVQTAIGSAQTDGETVGGYVIAAVAGLVVVGVIIAIIKKL